MPKKATPLVAAEVATAPVGFHADGGGLYLAVGANSRSWVFRYQIAGRRRDMGIGPADLVGLAEARAKLYELRRMVLQGIDPLEQRRSDRATRRVAKARLTTFKECAAAFIAANEAGWRNPKHRAQWSATLSSYAYPVIGELPVQDIDTALVLKVLEPIWSSKPETASRLRGRIETVLDYAKTRGYRTGENLARWKGHLSNLLPARGKVARVEHHGAMPYPDVPGFMTRLAGTDTIGARAMRFTILTAARTSEAIEARWSEIDLERALWIIPAERMKAAREHRVPLSAPALEILAELAAIRTGGYVFPGQNPDRPLSNMALLAVLRRMKLDCTTHGFRSSFRDWCAEQATGYPNEVAEMALAHQVGSAVEQAYRRSDLFERRRGLAADWAKFCTG